MKKSIFLITLAVAAASAFAGLQHETVEGVDIAYRVVGETSYIGDGTNAAVSVPAVPDDVFVVPIPVQLGGHPVAISSNAFANCTNNLVVLEFLGAPPSVVEAGAFPPDVYGYYAPSARAAWAAVSETRRVWEEDCFYWQGLYLVSSPYVRTWSDVGTILRAGDADAMTMLWLKNDIVQDGAAVAITNFVYLELAGYSLSVNGNGMATVSSGGTLVLEDMSGTSVVDCGSGVSGGEWNGVVRVGAGGSLLALDVLFANCTNSTGGGVASFAADGQGDFERCSFVGCSAPFGGAIFSQTGTVSVTDCTFARNRATDGAILYARGGSAFFTDCVVTNNAATDSASGVFHLVGNASCAQTNGFFAANSGGSAALPLARLESDGEAKPTFVTGGGIIERLPVGDKGVEATDFLAAGLATAAHRGKYVVLAENTFQTTPKDEIVAGTFTFDPKRAPHASALTFHPDVTIVGIENHCYVASIVSAGPYKATTNGVEITYMIRNGQAYIGDGTNGAISVTSATQLVVPAALDGFKVAGILTKAYANCTAAKEISFLGLPPETLEAGALPSGIKISFSAEYVSEWSKVIVDGKWKGYEVLAPRCFSWTDARKMLESGTDVVLGCSLEADGVIVCIHGETCRPTLDLNGRTITLPASNYPLFSLDNGGSLTLSDSAGGGKIDGAQRTFSVKDGACVYVGSNAEFVMTGGTIANFNGGTQVERPCVVYVCTTGMFSMQGGEISSCSSLTAVHASGKGLVVFCGGRIAGNKSGAKPVIFSSGASSYVSFADGTFENNESTDKLFSAEYGGRIVFFGTVLTGNKEKSVAASVPSTCGNTSVYGGLFDVEPYAGKIVAGYECVTVGSWKTVAREQTVAMANGVLTAGLFAYNPLEGSIRTALGGALNAKTTKVSVRAETPALYALSVTYVVTCKTSDELRANILAGNEVRFDVDFDPDPTHKMPSGFVYRASAVDNAGQGATGSLKIGLKLYEAAKGGKPVWSGETNVTAASEGVFQVWVSDAIGTSGNTRKLEEVFKDASAVYLGVTIDGGEECVPRRTLVTTPLVNRSKVAAAFDSEAIVDRLQASTATCGTLNLNGGLCATLEIAATNVSYNVAEMDVGGVTLYRNSENRILSSSDSVWTEGVIRQGDTLIYSAPKSGLLTLQSTEDCSVPLLVVPVPAGGAFVWQSDTFTGRYRFTAFGENE